MTQETDRTIPLTLVEEVSVPDWSGVPGWDGYSVPSAADVSGAPREMKPASVTIEADGESSQSPANWIWLMFFTEDEPWYRMTYEEAQAIRDRLSDLLKDYEKLSPVEQVMVNY